MKIYRIPGMYCTSAKLIMWLRGNNAQLIDYNGDTRYVGDLSDDELIDIVEAGNRHECDAIIPADPNGIIALCGLNVSDRTIKIETIDVCDINAKNND